MNNSVKRRTPIGKLTVIAMLSALSSVLMFFSFSVPMMPSFIKLDFSELPALIAAYALGPVSGVIVCLVKNLVNLFFSTTMGIGEACNFLLGAFFVLPAGLVYARRKRRSGALTGALIGAVVMAGLSAPLNYYITYPVYANFMPMEAILGMYRVINPNVRTLWDALIWFNMPFTFIKGMCSVAIAFVIYKPLSPAIKKISRIGG